MGRAMSSLWGTFVVLFIAMYTAKLSSILVAQDADVSSSGKIQSMADVRDFGGGRILTFTGEPMRQRIINAHPYLRITEVGALSGMTSVKISHLFDQYDAEAIILPIATAQTAVLNANNCDVKITAPVQVSGGGFIASISGCRANLHVVLDGLLMEIENDGTVDMIASKYENVDACDERFSANGGLELNNGMNTPNDNKLTQPLSMHQMFGLYMFVAGSMTLIWVGWKVEKRYHFVEHNFNGFSFRERESDVLKSVEVGGGGGTGRDIGTGREPKGPGIEGEKRPGPEYPGIEKRPSPESEDGFESTEDAEKG